MYDLGNLSFAPDFIIPSEPETLFVPLSQFHSLQNFDAKDPNGLLPIIYELLNFYKVSIKERRGEEKREERRGRGEERSRGEEVINISQQEYQKTLVKEYANERVQFQYSVIESDVCSSLSLSFFFFISFLYNISSFAFNDFLAAKHSVFI